MTVQSTTFAHPKCRGAWVCFTCGRSGETCSKRSARNSEPCEFTHLGERHTRFREFSAVGTGHSPKERHFHSWSTHICLCYKKKDTTNVPFGPRTPPNCFAKQLRCDALHLCWWLGPLRSPTPNAVALGCASLVVGVARLELAASWSRTKRATKLRYTPTTKLIILCLLGFGKCFQ